MKTVLNIRVEESIKNEIERLAGEEGISPSEFARNILSDYLGYEEEDENYTIESLGTMIIDCSIPFHKGDEFILFVSWLFSKGMYPNNMDNNSFVSYIKSMVEKAIIDYEFSNELRFEFLKVLNDINRCLIEPDVDAQQFNFCHQGNMYTFNYAVLISEVWRISMGN